MVPAPARAPPSVSRAPARRGKQIAAAFLAASLALAGCSSPNKPGPAASASPTPTRTSLMPPFGRVAIVMMENKEYGQIIGNAKAPYLNALARSGALATNFHGTTHPSLPNYLALIGGSTFGITENCTDCHLAEPSLVDQLESAGITW